jgi:hypothetical protein
MHDALLALGLTETTESEESSPREGLGAMEALQTWRRGPGCRRFHGIMHACELPVDDVAEGVDDGELRLGQSSERTPGTNRGRMK